MRYGIRNVKANAPYALGDGVTALPFSIGEASGARPPRGIPFRRGILTVPDSEPARSLARAAAQSVSFGVRGFQRRLVEDDTREPGVVTFAFDYQPVGFCFIVR